MSTSPSTRPALRYLLTAALLFQGVSGVAGGIALVSDPTGGLLGLPLGWLVGSPFSDYFIPGMVLLVGLGIFPLLVVYGLQRRRSWAWPAALLVGLALLIWIGVEMLVIGYHPEPPLQLIYGLLGLVLLVLALLPPVRRYYAAAPERESAHV